MQKNIRWIAGILAFWILAFSVFGVVNEILRRKTVGKVDMIHSFYGIEKNTIDVVSVGSSHSYHSIQPNLLWGKYGISSYVMSSQGQSVPCSYYLIKEIFKYQTPKVVMLETYCLKNTGLYANEGFLRQVVDGMRFGETKVELLNDFFPDYTWKEKLSYYIPFLLYHARWSELKDEDFSKNAWMKGGILNFKQVPQTETPFPEEARPLPKNSKEYLDKIVEFCEEKGTQLVLYAAPFACPPAAERALGVSLTVEKYAEEKGIPFLFFQKTRELNIDLATDYYDEQHLNSYGTEKLTNRVGEWLIQNYGLADHRQEEKYESWNEDYERYVNLVAEMTSVQ